MWTEIRNFLDARGENISQHSSGRVIMTLAHGLYEEAENRVDAAEMAKLVLAKVRRVRSDLRTSNSPAAHDELKTKDIKVLVSNTRNERPKMLA